MNKKIRPSNIFGLCCLLAFCLLLEGCALDRGINQLRLSNFAEPRDDAPIVNYSAKAVYLRASANGEGLTAESMEAANALLNLQGPLPRQVITIIPLTTAGKNVAPRLAKALRTAGAKNPQLGSYEVASGENNEAVLEQLSRQQNGWDLELLSEAVVTEVSDCGVADSSLWTVYPYHSVGTLGCANQANIAMMVSDPRDLLRPRALEPAEGNVSASAIERYQNGEIKDLIDIDFSGD